MERMKRKAEGSNLPSLPATLAQELSSWLEHLRAEDRAPSTLRDYETDVRSFVAWAAATGGTPARFSAVTGEDARSYRNFLVSSTGTERTLPTRRGTQQTGRLSPATVNRRLGTLAALLDFLGTPSGRNPFRGVKRITLERGAPRALSRTEWNAVRRSAAAWEAKDGGLALAVVSLLRHAGLRASELTGLAASDVTMSEKAGQVRIRLGKGMKARFVPLNADAREGLAPWLSTRPSVLAGVRSRAESKGVPVAAWAHDEHGPFLVGQRGPFTRRGIGMITEKLGKRAGLAAPLSPHQLRHTFATAAIDPQGYGLTREPVPLAALQRMMGHAKIETTAVYTRFSDEECSRFIEEDSRRD